MIWALASLSPRNIRESRRASLRTMTQGLSSWWPPTRFRGVKDTGFRFVTRQGSRFHGAQRQAAQLAEPGPDVFELVFSRIACVSPPNGVGVILIGVPAATSFAARIFPSHIRWLRFTEQASSLFRLVQVIRRNVFFWDLSIPCDVGHVVKEASLATSS